MVLLCISNFSTICINFSFSLKRFKTFPWLNAIDMMAFLFVRRICSCSFIISAAFWVSLLSQLDRLVLLVRRCVDCYGVSQLLFDFIFVKTLCLLAVFRVSPQLKTKNNRYIINLKYPLQTKIQLCWTQNAFFSI